MTNIHDFSAVAVLARQLKLDPQRLRRLRNAFYKKRLPAEAALAELPDDVRAEFAAHISFYELRLVSRHDSALDGATKLVFATADDLLIESVILRMTSGRTALCVSTQVGCAANCDFCATGKMGIARNLSAAQILDQLVHASGLLLSEGRSVRNLVFMGMGEPLHNEEQLYAALDVLADPGCFHLHPNRALVSTVGIPEAMVRFARRFPAARLAVSLHSARQETRAAIMPIARRHDLAELRAALVEVATVQGHEVMIEYLLLADVNDQPEDAAALIDYVRGIPVHVNLIPYNPIAEAPHLAGSDAERREAFSRLLKAAGLPVTTRYSLGADIAAACGQLVRAEHRRSQAQTAVPAALRSIR
ncbi:MAG: 23S rRNA (adenine(2503)-C(2))-methyltransferase RlmN [Pirellulales bacterium]